MTIDFKNPTPLYVQIVNDIKEKISSGELKVGDRVSSQNELAATYSVSLITVKKALADLIKEGVLYSRVGKGTYVARKSTFANLKEYRTIGFVLRDLDSPFFSKILSNMEKVLSRNEFNLLLRSSDGNMEKEESQIQHFLELGVDGLIIASMSRVYFASSVLRELQQRDFPYVVVSYIADEDIAYVGTDHEEGAYIAARHLIDLGYPQIGYINGETGSLLGEVRRKGYMRALQEANLQFAPEFEYHLRLRGEWYDFQSGYEIGQEMVKTKRVPEAVFAYNDLSALGLEKALLDNGLRVPEDVAIVGFDNIKRGLTALVPLTTIHQPTDRIGELAAERVIRKIRGETVPLREILKPTLIVRDSCGARRLFPEKFKDPSPALGQIEPK